MWELDHEEGWMPKNWSFQTVVLEKTFESPLDCKEIKPVHPKGNQPWIFIGGTDAEAEVQYFGYLVQSIDSLEKTLMLGNIKGRRRRGLQRLRWLDSITDSTDMSLSKLWEIVKDRKAWHAAVHEAAKSWTQMSDWTSINRLGKINILRQVRRVIKSWTRLRDRTEHLNNVEIFHP